jgi:hypothetical protein
MTHDYIRHGTTTLFAALNVLDGTVIGQCMARHRHQELIRFLNRPGQDRCRGQFGAVIGKDRLGAAADRDDAVKLACHPNARDRRIGHQRQTFARAVVDHRQDAKAPAIGH